MTHFTPDPTPTAADLTDAAGLAQVLTFDQLDSTQSDAARLADDGSLALPGAVVAWRQTAGRGRGPNRWWSDEGSLTVTFALPIDPDCVADRPINLLPLRVGVAIRDALLRWVAPDRLWLKWPNDLLARSDRSVDPGSDRESADRKLAGILCERVRAADLVGVGLNIKADLSQAPGLVRDRGISLRELSNQAHSRLEVFGAVGRAVRDAWDIEDWNQKFNACHLLHGRRVLVGDPGSPSDPPIQGICEGVDPEGRLMVRDGTTTHRLMNGTVLRHGV